MIYFASFVALVAAFAASSVVADPGIISPNTGTVWTAGSTQQVNWEVSNLMPPTCGDPINTALLFYRSGNAVEGAAPLAQNFSIVRGFISITVPTVSEATADYQVFLKADTSDPTGGSLSNEFTINPAAASTA